VSGACLRGHRGWVVVLCSVVVVASGFLGGVDVGWVLEPGDAGGDVVLPLFFVDEVVVVGAEEDAVVGVGGSAV
jgi:hypothetical protein